jgi:hypothetical protein
MTNLKEQEERYMAGEPGDDPIDLAIVKQEDGAFLLSALTPKGRDFIDREVAAAPDGEARVEASNIDDVATAAAARELAVREITRLEYLCRSIAALPPSWRRVLMEELKKLNDRLDRIDQRIVTRMGNWRPGHD